MQWAVLANKDEGAIDLVLLIRYEAARHALDEAKNLNKVKDVIDKGESLMRYARLARNPELMGAACDTIKVSGIDRVTTSRA